MKAFSAWIYERSRLFRAGMQRTGSRAWRAVCRTDKKLEIAFYRMIVLMMLLMIPLGLVVGGVIGPLLVISVLLKSFFAHRRQPSKREHR